MTAVLALLTDGFSGALGFTGAVLVAVVCREGAFLVAVVGREGCGFTFRGDEEAGVALVVLFLRPVGIGLDPCLEAVLLRKSLYLSFSRGKH